MALNLNKLFVRVEEAVSLETIISESMKSGNQKKVYFLENSNQIVVRGIAYGVDPSTVRSITDLQTLIGAEKITDASALSQSVIERLQKLERIQVATADDSDDYLSITTDSSVPTLHANVVPIETASDGSTGLVDVMNAKRYINERVAAATTEVVEGKGVDVTKTTHTDGHAIYTIDSSLALQYNAASDNNPATITLTGANGGVFGTVNVSDIVGNGVIDHTQYYPGTGELVLSFKTGDGTTTQDVSIDLKNILDLGDLMVKADSTNYLEITQVTPDPDSDENQLSFAIKTVDVSTATASATGLADAFKVKEYVDAKVSDKNVSAEGDNYITANAANNKVTVTADVQNLTATAGTPGTYDAEGTQTADPTHGALNGTANSLADAADIATKVKTYVDGELAIETARIDASLIYNIKALDADVSTKGTNVSVGVTEVDGKITAVNVTETYAEISYDPTTDVWSNTANVSTGLVTGQDIETLKSYVDDKVRDSSMDAQGDDYITADIDSGNNKKIVVTADVQPLVVTTTAGTDTILTGVEKSLADSSNIAASVTSFVNTRINEEVAKLDATANVADTSSYINVSIGEVDGLLNSASSSIDVTYGSFTGATPTDGIATREGVQDFVDTYDFWETYSASNNNNNNGGN